MAKLGYLQVTRICNQRCLFCSNPENNSVISLEQARIRLLKLVSSGYDGVILTGGEPTLHPDLGALIRLAGKSFGTRVRIITNGQKTAEDGILEELVEAGLEQVHVSFHSVRPDVQAYLTSNPTSSSRIEKTIEKLGKMGVGCTVNSVICAQNADHLDETVSVVVKRFPFIRHFVFNNIDPKMNRVLENPHVVARLADLELSLDRAVRMLESTGRTVRVERIPLCYMARFSYASTETRKIVKGEERTVHFLDEKGEIRQTEFIYSKPPVCDFCSLKAICAGLYDCGGRYDPVELHPVFVDPGPIIQRIREHQ